MPASIRVLIFGDIVGKLGRKTLRAVLPEWQSEYRPDLILANVENLAHGKGVTDKTVRELAEAGVTGYTAGDHIWEKMDPAHAEMSGEFTIALPANDPRSPTETHLQRFAIEGTEICVATLLGRVFMSDIPANPFTTFDEVAQRAGAERPLIIDIHAEATSEKIALGYWADGRASVVYGTHTHVPTADERILPEGTGYITDIGMTGARDTVLGVEKKIIIDRFLERSRETFQYPESGIARANAILCDIDAVSRKCKKITRLTKELAIE